MRYLRWGCMAGAGVAVLVTLGTACAGTSPTPTESEPPTLVVSNVRVLTPTPAPSPSTSEEYTGHVPQGAALFDKQCAACHGTGGEGGFAPALTTAEFHQEFAEDASLAAIVRNGRGGMPPFGADRLADQELADLVTYIRSLGGAQDVRVTAPAPSPTSVSSPTPTPTPAPSPSTSEEYTGHVPQGAALFDKQCAACHGTGGEGGFAPTLTTAEFHQEFAEDASLAAIVRNGRGGMPPFGTDRLADQELADLVAYIRSLREE